MRDFPVGCTKEVDSHSSYKVLGPILRDCFGVVGFCFSLDYWIWGGFLVGFVGFCGMSMFGGAKLY